MRCKEAKKVKAQGYFSKEIVKNLQNEHFATRIAEPEYDKCYSWNGDYAAQKAVYANRSRLKSEVGKAGMRKRGEIVERSFQHVLDRGGQRRSHLRGRENVEKAYLLAVCAHNFGLIMRKITTKGTPKGLGGGGMHMACLWLQEMAYIVCYFDMCKTSDCSPNWVISLIVVIKF